MTQLSLVPVDQIPPAYDCSTDDLIQIYKICLRMQDLCLKEGGVGLAAVQVGIPLRLFIMKTGESFRYFVNCRYSDVSHEVEKTIEGCLSIKNSDGGLRYFEVPRFKKVRVQGQELVVGSSLQIQDVNFIPEDDLSKIIFQHEIDHSGGNPRGKQTLISDIGVEYEVWKNAT